MNAFTMMLFFLPAAALLPLPAQTVELRSGEVTATAMALKTEAALAWLRRDHSLGGRSCRSRSEELHHDPLAPER